MMDGSLVAYSELSTEQHEQVTQLLAQVKAQYGNAYPPQFARCRSEEDRRVLAYKYLKARRWSLKDAMEMVTKTMNFREENKLDGMPLFPCPFPLRGYDEADIREKLGDDFSRPYPSILDRYYYATSLLHSWSAHYWDKEGHPVLYVLHGRVQAKTLITSLKRAAAVGQNACDVVLTFHLYINEFIQKLEEYTNILATTSGGMRLHGVTVVIDCSGLSSRILRGPLLKLTRDVIRASQQHFPEALHRLLVINCAPTVLLTYSVIRGALDSTTQKKIVLVKKANSLEALREVIDNDKIPSSMGGACDCEGGCVPDAHILPEGDDDSLTEEDAVVTEYVTVSARQKHSVTHHLIRGEEVFWEFVSITKRSVGFSVVYIPCCESGITVPVVPLARLNDGAGHYVAESPGALIITWDNSSSRVTSKKIQLRVFKNMADPLLSSIGGSSPLLRSLGRDPSVERSWQREESGSSTFSGNGSPEAAASGAMNDNGTPPGLPPEAAVAESASPSGV